MKIAVEGCAHGELEKIYETIQNLENQENVKIDLLICCGDFQSTRNLDDLQTMAVPKKFQDICTFYKYYSGEKIAPILTLFIGGNHEASNYLQELPYGGWVAPNIYYLGLAGVVKVNGIRIAGISGIYKGHDYLRGHHEFSPYNDSTIRSVYHVRQLEVFRLKQLSDNIDICISHDWPRGVYNYGNCNQLIRFKPHFKDEIDNDKLGSPPCADILDTLQPVYWFAAHLHCKFAALIPHKNSDKTTKFLALDKCLPKRRFLQILDIETENTDDTGNVKFEYDLEWLTILFLTNHLLSTKTSPCYMPGPNGTDRYDFTPTDDEKLYTLKKFNDLIIPKNFVRTVEPYNPNDRLKPGYQPKSQINPQTTQFCDTLCIDDPVSVAMLLNGHELSHSSTLDNSSDLNNTSSFCLESEQTSFNSTCETSPIERKTIAMNLPQPHSIHPDEIIVESDEDILENVKIDVSNESLSKSSILDHSVASIDSNQHDIATEKQNDDEDKVNPPIKKFKRRNQSIYAMSDDTVE